MNKRSYQRNGATLAARSNSRIAVSLTLLILFLLVDLSSAAAQVAYDVVAVRAPRYGDTTQTKWQEVSSPVDLEPGQDLVLIHQNGTEEVLYDCPSNGCSVVDPAISFDGTKVYFSLYPNATSSGYNPQRGMPYQGADIYVMNIATRATTRLTRQEWSPNTGVVPWAPDPLGATGPGYKLGYGIVNLGPSPFPGPDGREWIVFVSNRNAFIPARGLTHPNLQLFVMDEFGENVRHIGHFNLASALHPSVLTDGRIMFSSAETQGVRDSRNWGLWAVYPDGRNFEPLHSSMTSAVAYHFQTQFSNGHIGVDAYYNLNNNGFGTIFAFPSTRQSPGPNFGSPIPNDPTNPNVRAGIWFFAPGHPTHLQPRYYKFSFSPLGLYNLTAFSHFEDNASSRTVEGNWAGKVTHPSGAPGNDVLVVYTPGPANDLDRPTTLPRVNGGIYVVKNGVPIDHPANLTLIKTDVSYNYQQPRALVPYSQIYGVARPQEIPFLPDGGTPFGEVGTASFYNRNSKAGFGASSYSSLDSFNTAMNDESSNWSNQGADAGIYSNSDIWAVRILSMEPSSHLSYGPAGDETRSGFSNVATERLRILGEIPLRKFDSNGQQLVDGDGNPDTSFLARIPADVPFTFQTLDRDGLVLNMSQTWHQVRPGENRHDCGGCHAHANRASDFSQTAAARPGYQVPDVVNYLSLLSKDSSGNPSVTVYTGAERKQRMDVEYQRDIKPIFQRSCVGCHSGATPAGKLDLSSTPQNGWDVAYNCLANDQSANCGYKPVIAAQVWRQTNMSRWVRAFQSRRSLLVWKIFGRRLDGWLNSDHPTESVPGDATTLPPGANRNLADLDYTGTIMPPPGSGYQPLTEDEKMTIARWVDLGAPSNRPNGSRPHASWFTDELRPTLHVAWPPTKTIAYLDTIQFVAHDYYSGLQTSSLSVTADFPVNGKPAGTNLAGDFALSGEGKWVLGLSTPITNLPRGVLNVQIADVSGNIAKESVTFKVDPAGIAPVPPGDPFPPGGPPNVPPSSKVKLSVPRGPVKLRLVRDGKKLGVAKEFSVEVKNISLRSGSSVTLSTSGRGARISGAKQKLKLKSKVRAKIKAAFSKAGTYTLLVSAKHTGGIVRESVSFVILPPKEPRKK